MQPLTQQSSQSPSQEYIQAHDPQAIRQALLATLDASDPCVLLLIELTVLAFTDCKRMFETQLVPSRGLAVLDVEAKARRRAAQHVRDMVFSLRELSPPTKPTVQIQEARPIQPSEETDVSK